MKKLTAPEKRRVIALFSEGMSVQDLARAYFVTGREIEDAIRQDAIKRERARK